VPDPPVTVVLDNVVVFVVCFTVLSAQGSERRHRILDEKGMVGNGENHPFPDERQIGETREVSKEILNELVSDVVLEDFRVVGDNYRKNLVRKR
jgi:hypothetical protein